MLRATLRLSPALLLLPGLLLVACGPVEDGPLDAGRFPPRPDAGETTLADAGEPPPEPACTSDTFWTRGNNGSERMRPGHACIACHTNSVRTPRFKVAGTLFPTLHEPSDCNGVDGTVEDVLVEVTSATGTKRTLTVNEAGNFFTETALTFPLRVKVKRGTAVREMQADVTNGDCNSCHTVDGANDAPGRIRPPDPE